jgi:hypothetical protein
LDILLSSASATFFDPSNGSAPNTVHGSHDDPNGGRSVSHDTAWARNHHEHERL